MNRRHSESIWGWVISVNVVIVLAFLTLFMWSLFAIQSKEGINYSGFMTLVHSAIVLAATVIYAYYAFYKDHLWMLIKRLIVRRDEYQEITIVGVMAKERLGELFTLSYYVIIYSSLSSYLCLISTKVAPIELYIGTCLVLLLFIFRYLTFIYRVRFGFYGSHIKEAKEIIEFVKSVSTKKLGDDGDNGNNKRKILPSPIISKSRENVILPGSEGVQNG